MCGIFGLRSAEGQTLNLAVLRQAMSTIRRRGPDDEGYLLCHTAAGRIQPYGGPDTDPRLNLPPLPACPDEAFDLALGFRRLAILDLSPGGHQPMVSCDGRYWLVFNGEIYNYLELKPELESLGYVFRSHSDSEVLLASYACWGHQALNRLVGMFACAILDVQARRLFLARDFFGIKPLYYTYGSGGFAFASEIKALLELPGVTRQVNPQRLYDYLRFRLTDHAGETLFSSIQQLPAAHYLEIWLDNPQPARPVRYWQIDLNQRLDLPFDEATARLRELFLENVTLHLRSDVPVGAALSGGIDSSSIVMAMRYLQGQTLQLHTFSHITHDPILGEERWVDLIGQASGARVGKVEPSPEELAAGLDQLIYIQDEPFGSTTIYAQYRVFQLAQQAGIKVMLDGQGADELLAGYRPYLAARLASLLRQGHLAEAIRFVRQAAQWPGSGTRELSLEAMRLLLPPHFQGLGRQLVSRSLFPAWLNAAWFTQHGVTKAFGWNYGSDVLREQLHRTLVEVSLPSLLRYEDRNSMAFSIESRVPFLTPALVNFIFALPGPT
ncbi:MAG: asparagine synthase (glutamine-hydrolyzing) [Anaerolineae bacterium]